MSTNAAAQSNLSDLDNVLRIGTELSKKGLTVYRCRYDFLAFGSWLIEAGTSHRRIQIARDGKESQLRFSISTFMSASSPADWREVESLPDRMTESHAVFTETVVAVAERHIRA